jgi:hypothetical protein
MSIDCFSVWRVFVGAVTAFRCISGGGPGSKAGRLCITLRDIWRRRGDRRHTEHEGRRKKYGHRRRAEAATLSVQPPLGAGPRSVRAPFPHFPLHPIVQFIALRGLMYRRLLGLQERMASIDAITVPLRDAFWNPLAMREVSATMLGFLQDGRACPMRHADCRAGSASLLALHVAVGGIRSQQRAAMATPAGADR